MNGINIFGEIFLDLEIIRHLQTEDDELCEYILDEIVDRVYRIISMLTDQEEKVRAINAANEFKSSANK